MGDSYEMLSLSEQPAIAKIASEAVSAIAAPVTPGVDDSGLYGPRPLAGGISSPRFTFDGYDYWPPRLLRLLMRGAGAVCDACPLIHCMPLLEADAIEYGQRGRISRRRAVKMQA